MFSAFLNICPAYSEMFAKPTGGILHVCFGKNRWKDQWEESSFDKKKSILNPNLVLVG